MDKTTKIVIAGAAILGTAYVLTKKKSVLQPVNLLQNPGFEQPGVGWTISQNGLNAQITTELSLYGSSLAMNYMINDGTEIVSAFQDVSVIGNKLYNFGGKIKINNVVATLQNGASVYLRWLDSAKAFISNGQIMTAVVGTLDWVNYDGVVVAPLNAVFAQVICTLSRSTGKALFDDIYLYEK